MSDPSAGQGPRYQPKDRWGLYRILIAGWLGTMVAGSQWILDFWPLGAGGSLGQIFRDLFDLSRLLIFLPLAGFIVGLLIAAGIALFRRYFRRATSSVLAIVVMPICFMAVAKAPFCDPWLWYAIFNSRHFEEIAANRSTPNGLKYAVIEIRDVSTGWVGVDPNHFVALIYDKSDAVGLDPAERPNIWQLRTMRSLPDATPIPRGRRLYGHFFRVDDFE